MLISAQSEKFASVPRKTVPRGPEPPPYGTAVSFVPRNWISVIGRAGEHSRFPGGQECPLRYIVLTIVT
jgi:hypothetical protein